MKSRSAIWACVAADAAARCSVQTTRDLETVTRRVAKEGDPFFKVSLPAFAKDLELALERRLIEPDMFVGFRRRLRTIGAGGKGKKIHHGIPEFLQEFMEILFDDSYDVSWDEYLGLQRCSEISEVPLSHFFSPMLRIPESPEEKERMASAIQSIRQLCLMFGKEKELCSDSATEAAIEAYKSCDEELMLPFKTVE